MRKTGSAPVDQGLLLAKLARYCCDWPWTRRAVSYLDTRLDSLNEKMRPVAATDFCRLWSSAFIAAKFGLEFVEPLTFMASRFGFVTIIFVAIALIMGAFAEDHVRAFNIAVVGLLLHAIYLRVYFPLSMAYAFRARRPDYRTATNPDCHCIWPVPPGAADVPAMARLLCRFRRHDACPVDRMTLMVSL